MYLFELFDEAEPVPLLPIFDGGTAPFNTLEALGLSADNILSWANVCAAIIGQGLPLYRDVRSIIADTPDPKTTTRFVLNALSLRNYYKYKAYRDAILSDYDPIANYDMRETTTTTYNGEQTTSTTQTTDSITSHTEEAATDSTKFGATTTTTTVDAAEDSVDTPKTTTTNTRGATRGTSTTAAATTTEALTRDVYGYNSPAQAQPETAETKTTNAPEQTTTQTTDAATDTATTEAFTVTNNIGARKAIEGNAEHTDTTTRGARTTRDTQRDGDRQTTTAFNNRQDVTQVTRAGNIGVTTSQQLLLSEIQLKKATEYINILATDIINALTIGVYGMGGL